MGVFFKKNFQASDIFNKILDWNRFKPEGVTYQFTNSFEEIKSFIQKVNLPISGISTVTNLYPAQTPSLCKFEVDEKIFPYLNLLEDVNGHSMITVFLNGLKEPENKPLPYSSGGDFQIICNKGKWSLKLDLGWTVNNPEETQEVFKKRFNIRVVYNVLG